MTNLFNGFLDSFEEIHYFVGGISLGIIIGIIITVAVLKIIASIFDD